MHILFVVPYTPTAIRTRPYHLIKTLSQRGHSVTLATLWEEHGERAFLREIEGEGVRVIAQPLRKTRIALSLCQALLSGSPLQGRYNWHPRLLKDIHACARQNRSR